MLLSQVQFYERNSMLLKLYEYIRIDDNKIVAITVINTDCCMFDDDLRKNIKF